MSSAKRMPPGERREAILSVAMTMAREHGYDRITRDAIAEQAGVSMGLVTRYFGTMVKLRRDIMRHAILDEVLEVVAQGVAANDAHAQKAPLELRQRALANCLK